VTPSSATTSTRRRHQPGERAGRLGVTGGTIDVIGAPGDYPRPGCEHYIDFQSSSGQPGHFSFELPVPVSDIYLVQFEWSGNPRDNHALGSYRTEEMARSRWRALSESIVGHGAKLLRPDGTVVAE